MGVVGAGGACGLARATRPASPCSWRRTSRRSSPAITLPSTAVRNPVADGCSHRGGSLREPIEESTTTPEEIVDVLVAARAVALRAPTPLRGRDCRSPSSRPTTHSAGPSPTRRWRDVVPVQSRARPGGSDDTIEEALP